MERGSAPGTGSEMPRHGGVHGQLRKEQRDLERRRKRPKRKKTDTRSRTPLADVRGQRRASR